MKKAQSILEYLALMGMAVVAVTAGTIIFGQGAKSGLGDANEYLDERLPETVDETHEGQINTFDVPGLEEIGD